MSGRPVAARLSERITGQVLAADPCQAVIMSYDVASVRAHFPALAAGYAHFDGPGGSQVPDVVATAVAETMVSPLANRGRVTAAERTADDIVAAARRAMADLLGADPRGIVFGRSMTALTFDMARTLAAGWGPGDEIVVSRLDHDANIRPWVQVAHAVGATIRWAEFDPATGELGVDAVAEVLSPRTRLVAVTAASNLIGTRPPVRAIADLAHEAGALTYVDGVHFTAHAAVHLDALGADFFGCSPYKLLGPHCGVLAAKPELLETLTPAKLLPSTDAVPERFELGTLPYELLAGTTAAVDFLAGLAPAEPAGPGSAAEDRRQRLIRAMGLLEHFEDGLRDRIEAGLAELPAITCYSRAVHRTPTLLLGFADRDPKACYEFLAERGVNAPAGSFYALEASRRLGLGDGGALRVGLAPYVDESDVERLLAGLGAFVGG